MRIDKLTPKQSARFSEWAKKWIDIGLSTEPADFEKATEAALAAYKLCNLKKPMVILRMGSPYAATLGGALAWAHLRALKAQGVEPKVGAQVGDQVRDQVWAQVRAQVRDQVRDQVWAQVWAQVGAQVRDQVGDQVWAQVRAQVRDQVRDQVGDQVGDQVWDQVWDQVGAQVGAQVGDQVWDQVWDQVGNSVYNDGPNALWAQWTSYVSFFREVCAWDNPILEKAAIDEALVTSCGWTWWHENVLAISDRPKVINRDARGRLHCENGPSIAYRDGWSLYHWHGVIITEQIAERPGEITIQQIRDESNAEVRRVLIERFGYQRYLDEAGLQLVEARPDNDPVIGLRTAKLFRDDVNGIVLLDVLNSTPEPDGSIKRYTLSVDPEAYDGRAGREIIAAMASTWRKADYSLYFQTPEAYRPEAES